jgi:predicted nucleic acid-binding protein
MAAEQCQILLEALDADHRAIDEFMIAAARLSPRIGRLSADDATDALAPFRRLPMHRLLDSRDLAAAALRSASLLDHAFHDCLCLALAMDAGAAELMAEHRFDKATASLVVDLAALWQLTA